MASDFDVDADSDGFAALAPAFGACSVDRPAPAAGTDVVPVNGEIVAVFDVHDSILTLPERKRRILDHLDRAATDIGGELLAAKAQHPGVFVKWVETELPFGLDRAERLMSIARAFSEVDPAVKEMLPSAWTALYELSRVPPLALVRAIDIGDVSPAMTVAEARDFVARENGRKAAAPQTPPPLAEAHAIALMRYHAIALTEETLWKLNGWIQHGLRSGQSTTPSSPSTTPETPPDDDW